MKMEVRGFTVHTLKKKAKNRRNEEKRLQAELNELLSQSVQKQSSGCEQKHKLHKHV